MPKFDLKKISASSQSIKKDIDNTEKNRISKENEKQPESKAEEITSLIDTSVSLKAEKITEVDIEDNISTPQIEFTPVKSIEKSKKESKVEPQYSVNNSVIDQNAILQSENELKVASFTLPLEVKNYLKYQPKLEETTITQFLFDLIEKKQIEYEEKGIDINQNPDYSTMLESKTRSKGSKPSIVPVKIYTNQLKWLKRAALYHGLNLSQYMEEILRENMNK